jgi:hypothetical protein
MTGTSINSPRIKASKPADAVMMTILFGAKLLKENGYSEVFSYSSKRHAVCGKGEGGTPPPKGVENRGETPKRDTLTEVSRRERYSIYINVLTPFLLRQQFGKQFGKGPFLVTNCEKRKVNAQ